MLTAELARRIEGVFALDRFAEPDGWDFALAEADRAELRRRGSSQFRRTCNGLVGGDAEREIRRVYLLVFPELGLLDSVVRAERGRRDGGALVITHHPVDMETGGRGFVAIPSDRLDALDELGIGLFVLHAPLDCHAEISTSRAIGDGLGLRFERTFAPYVGGDAGVIGAQAAEPFDRFAERVRRLCELPWFRPDQVRFAGRAVERVAIVAGGGDDTGYLEQAQQLGCDTYLAGHWWTPHPGSWCDANRAAIAAMLPRLTMNLLSASHDGSELVVFRDRLAPLLASWGLEPVLLRQVDHWR